MMQQEKVELHKHSKHLMVKKLRKVFMPVPYNLGFELNILVKLNDDALQIVEQILPYFQPSFNVTVDLVNVIGEERYSNCIR